MIDVTHICLSLDYPKLYTNMATGNDVTSHENDLYNQLLGIINNYSTSVRWI